MTPRDKLLAGVVDHLLAHGLRDTSLRELAAATGTSHRMLAYHFGSRDGVLIAVVEEVERRQLEALQELNATRSPRAVMLSMHERLADPALAPLERLFFELYMRELHTGGGPLTQAGMATWLAASLELYAGFGFPPAAARAEATLGLAVSRGLLLDLLATGDRARIDTAARRHVDGVLARLPVDAR